VRRDLIAAIGLVTALTVVLTWPQALHLGTHVVAHDDPFLSIWRISWIAHALATEPRHLVDGNIFHPHLRTLAYTDITLLEGLVAAPWLWAGVNNVLVYNVLLFAGIIGSGVGMFVLSRHLTDDIHAGLISAAVFTLTPYRVEHVMHLELQWTMWIPLTFWAVHRVFESGAIKWGAIAGVLLCLQLMSSAYYGAFLALTAFVLALLLGVSEPGRAWRAAAPLAVAASIVLVPAALYGRPYIENARALGTRDVSEIAQFSARAASFVTAPSLNVFWGWTSTRFEGDELHLFPGLVPLVLGAAAFLTRRCRGVAFVYAAVAAVALELALGMNGWLYPWLLTCIWPLQGFRAPARFAILAWSALAVLGGVGFVAIADRLFARGRRLTLAAAIAALTIESVSAPMRLAAIPRRVPDIYRVLRNADRGVVLELPIVDWNLAPEYMYWSTYHWQPLVNGYSGHTPSDYRQTLAAMETFPSDQAIERVHALGVRYIVIHESYYSQRAFAAMMVGLLDRPGLVANGHYRDAVGDAYLFEVRSGG
jgi:hypothetical protein